MEIAVFQHKAENGNHSAEKAEMAPVNEERADNDTCRSQKAETQIMMNQGKVAKIEKTKQKSRQLEDNTVRRGTERTSERRL